jgi:hypothetical protein
MTVFPATTHHPSLADEACAEVRSLVVVLPAGRGPLLSCDDDQVAGGIHDFGVGVGRRLQLREGVQ